MFVGLGGDSAPPNQRRGVETQDISRVSTCRNSDFTRVSLPQTLISAESAYLPIAKALVLLSGYTTRNGLQEIEAHTTVERCYTCETMGNGAAGHSGTKAGTSKSCGLIFNIPSAGGGEAP